MDWETLKNDCLACQRCPLHTTRHNVVFGQGVENAEVLFVGEGPGQSEDEQGLPFVGRSGQQDASDSVADAGSRNPALAGSA